MDVMKSIHLAIIRAFTALSKMRMWWNLYNLLLFGLLQLSERWECDEIYTIGYYSGFYSSLKDKNWANGAHFGFWSGFRYDCFTFILDYDQVSEWVYRFWTKMPKFQTLFFKYLLISLGPFQYWKVILRVFLQNN